MRVFIKYSFTSVLALMISASLSAQDIYQPGEAVYIFATPASYPSDPLSDIKWSASCGKTDVTDVECAFNSARTVENTMLGTALPMLSMPAKSAWNSMNDGEKALWLINRERLDLEVPALHGIETNVTAVAQYYAQYLIDNNAWGHYEDGRSPWERLHDNEAIGSCHDFLSVAENLAVFWTSADSIALPVEQALYNWIYGDGNSSWGHRHTVLWYPYNDNSGTVGIEGFLGIGRVSGPHSGWNFTEMIVMNVFDPCASWSYSAGDKKVFLPFLYLLLNE